MGWRATLLPPDSRRAPSPGLSGRTDSSPTMHIVIAKATCRPDAQEGMRAVLTTLAIASRAEEGCLSYAFYSDVEDDTRFTSVEEWESAEAATAHMGTEHVAAAFAALPDLVAGPPEITIHVVASSAPLG